MFLWRPRVEFHGFRWRAGAVSKTAEGSCVRGLSLCMVGRFHRQCLLWHVTELCSDASSPDLHAVNQNEIQAGFKRNALSLNIDGRVCWTVRGAKSVWCPVPSASFPCMKTHGQAPLLLLIMGFRIHRHGLGLMAVPLVPLSIFWAVDKPKVCAFVGNRRMPYRRSQINVHHLDFLWHAPGVFTPLWCFICPWESGYLGQIATRLVGMPQVCWSWQRRAKTRTSHVQLAGSFPNCSSQGALLANHFFLPFFPFAPFFAPFLPLMSFRACVNNAWAALRTIRMAGLTRCG